MFRFCMKHTSELELLAYNMAHLLKIPKKTLIELSPNYHTSLVNTRALAWMCK